MKKIFIKTFAYSFVGFLMLLGIVNVVNAQNVGIGTTNPDASAALDITSGTQGLLIPRVALEAVDQADPTASPAHSLTVFNINPDIKGGNGIGIYYNEGTPNVPNWIKLATQDATAWMVNGNSGTTVDNFLGTTDNADVIVKRNNITALTITKGGAWLATGDPNTGVTPTSGAGSRMEWIPAKAAFRAGKVTGNVWDDVNIGSNSFAVGLNAKASGSFSIAMGSNTEASGSGAIAMGASAKALQDGSAAIGSETLAGAPGAFAFGQLTKATGLSSVAMGFNTTASGSNSVAMGNSTVAEAPGSVAMGEFTLARALNSVAIGRFNLGQVVNPNVPQPNDKVFQIGNGTGDNTRSDALFVERDGDVTIKGCLTAKNGLVCGPSDIRLKKDIVPIKNALNTIKNIQPIGFYFKDKNEYPSDHQIGFSAQEIEKTYPELVKKGEDGFLAVNYANMSAVAIQAIKEQQVIIKEQQEKLNTQQTHIQNQQKNIEQQDNLIDVLNTKNQDLEKRIELLEKVLLTNKK